MNNLNTVPSVGTFGGAISEVNANFALIVNAINSLEYKTTKSKGVLNYGTDPATAFPNAVSGDWCMILSEGNVFPATIKTFNGSTWSGSGTWNPDGINLNDYATTTALNTAVANSLLQATARMGYGEATASNNAYSVTIANYTLPTNGGVIRVKMPTSATGAATLNISETGAKTIWYNGLAVSSSNTWGAGEVISVFYDGTKYLASNSQGGGGNAEKIKYDNSASVLAANNVQGALDEVGKEVFVEGISVPLGSAIAYVINSVGNWNSSASTHYIINVNAGDKFKVSANLSSNCTCVWLRQASTPSQGGDAYVSNVDNNRYVVEAGGQMIVTAPSDAVQLFIQGKHSGIDHTPANVSSVDTRFDGLNDIVIGEAETDTPSTLTNEVILSSDYPAITSSPSYKLTGYIPVNEGDIINVPKITAFESSVIISGYSEQNQSSNVESLKIKGNGITNYDYVFIVPKGVNYIRIGGNNNSANTTKKYTLYTSTNKSIYAQQIRCADAIERQQKELLIKDAVTPYETLYPSIRPRKGCVMFQMDCNQYFFANALAYTELLKNYGVNYCTLLCLNNTFGTYVNTIKDLQSDGHEIAIHGTGVHSGNYEDTLKSYFTDFANNGILWDGYVELSTAITPAELLIAKKYFSWIIKNGGDYSALSSDYLNAIQTINEPPTELKRIGIELNHNQATQSNFNTMIANVKDAIDSVVENVNALVIYGHTYAQVQNTNYTVYNEVLEPILAYLKGYIDSKRVIVGRTTPLLDYFYTKRFNE